MESSKNSKIAIINGILYYNNKFITGSILIKNNKIKNVVFNKLDNEKLKEYQIIDAANSYVSYGFIDPHVHFRCPGHEYKEDWDTGSKAAIKGGYTFVIDMPNNLPSAKNYEIIKLKNKYAKKTMINYGFYIGLTDDNAKSIKKIYKKLKNKNIPIFGIKIFLGSSTGDLLIKKEKSIFYSLKTNLINLFHCEDEEVLNNYKSLEYNSIYDHEKIRPVDAEVNGIKKIIKVNKKNKKSKIYICHLSSKKGANLIKKLREKGYKIISEITPHHLYFYLQKIIDSNIYKVNPPIRNLEDVLELRNKFNKGFFQIIGTDHAPHLLKEKESNNPPSGFPGLESAFYALYNLYEQDIISLKMIFKLLTNGYKIFNIKKRGKLKKNNFADITIIKKEKNIFKAKETYTKADFSPYDGLETNCKVDTVIINGKILLRNGVFL